MSSLETAALFQHFSQADISITRKYGGSGLGLSICRQLVEMMGGEITVVSEPGKGSVFSFTAVFGLQSPEKQQQQQRPGAGELVGMRVLIVDDNASSLEVTREILQVFKIKAVTAASAAEGLTRIKKAVATGNPYDLVLMGWKMPGMDGIEACRRIKTDMKLNKTPVIIMVTGYDREEIRHQAEVVGIDGFLVKPLTPTVLFNTIEHLLVGNNRKPVDHRQGTALCQLPPCELRGTSILLVEDDEINQQVAQELLAHAGINVVVADNGKEALNIISKLEDKGGKAVFAAILMDIQMPVMDGYEASREIRRLKSAVSKTPIIAMTAQSMAGDRQKSLAAGMDDYIAKPVDPDEFYAVLLKWIKGGGESEDRSQKPEDRRPGIDDGKQRSGKGGNFESRESYGTPLPAELPGLDIFLGLKRVGGNAKLYRKLLLQFRKNHGNAVLAIKTAYAKGEHHLAVELAHTLKGVAGNIGAMELFEIIRQFESTFQRDDHSEITRILDNIEKGLLLLTASIASLDEDGKGDKGDKDGEDGKETPAGGSVVDLERLAPLFSELAELLAENDVAAKAYLEMIKETLTGISFMDKLDSLENLINRYDFDDALLLLRQTAAKIGVTIRNGNEIT